MIDFERVLSGVIRSRVRRRSPRLLRRVTSSGFGAGTGAAVGLGVLGLAFAAFEHFGSKDKDASRGTSPQPGGGPTPVPPPAPGGRSTPPPPPAAAPIASPPPLPGADASLLLLRGMIAAANADGEIDSQERRKILDRLTEEGIDSAEREFLLQEMENPQPVAELLPGLDSPELKRRFYVVSLLAIDVDTQAERDYLDSLALQLGIDEAQRRLIHDQLN